MTTNVDIITTLVHRLDHENTRLRAENEALRAGQGRWPDEAQKLRIRSEYLTIGTFSAPRVITADELREGQTVAIQVEGHWMARRIIHVKASSVVCAEGYAFARDIPETIVLLEDAPVKNVDTTPATWKENGENFTRSLIAGRTVTAEQVEAEARESSDHWLTTESAKDATEPQAYRDGYLTARTIAAEQVAELRKAKAEAWEEGHSWGWSDAQEAHDVRQDMTREDWSLKTPNPHRRGDDE